MNRQITHKTLAGKLFGEGITIQSMWQSWLREEAKKKEGGSTVSSHRLEHSPFPLTRRKKAWQTSVQRHQRFKCNHFQMNWRQFVVFCPGGLGEAFCGEFGSEVWGEKGEEEGLERFAFGIQTLFLLFNCSLTIFCRFFCLFLFFTFHFFSLIFALIIFQSIRSLFTFFFLLFISLKNNKEIGTAVFIFVKLENKTLFLFL